MLKAVIVLLASASTATAGVLPITGDYCDNEAGSAGVMLNADGISTDDDYHFAKIVRSGPNWWVVTYKEADMDGITSKIEVSADATQVTMTDSDDPAPYILTRCKP